MPTYEFRCPNGHTFDQLHKISDAPQTATCPVCGADAVRAISGGAGLVFKGSGFYLTDYGKNAHRTSGSAPAKGGEGGGESKGGESKGDGGTKDSGGSNAGAGGSTGGSTSGGGTTGGSSGGSSGGSTGGSSSGSSTSGGGSSSGGTAA